MKSLYESILSSTGSGSHYDPLGNLKREEYYLKNSTDIELLAKVWKGFYKDSIKREEDIVFKELKGAFEKADVQLQPSHFKYKIQLVLDKKAKSVIEDLYKKAKIKFEDDPPVLPLVANTNAPLIIVTDHPMWGETYYIWYWGDTSDLFGHGANRWQEIQKTKKY